MAPALQKIVVAPTTNPISMLLFSLGGQFENTFLGLGVRFGSNTYILLGYKPNCPDWMIFLAIDLKFTTKITNSSNHQIQNYQNDFSIKYKPLLRS